MRISRKPSYVKKAVISLSEFEKPGYWAVIPASGRYDQQIPANAKLLYAEVSSLTGKDGYCFASNEYFAKNFEWSMNTVSRLFVSLEKAGYIRIENKQSKHRKIFAGVNPLSEVSENSYFTKNGEVDEKSDSTSPKKVRYFTKKSEVHINNINTNTQKRASREPEWSPDRFSKFWEFYPHGSRGGKQAAVKAWDKLRLSDSDIDLLALGVKYDVDSAEWQRGIGIPHVSTYLNQERWRDALERKAEDENDDSFSPSGWAPDPERVKYV